MEITWIHYGVAFLAIILHILSKLQSKKKDGIVINPSVFFLNNWINISISVISVVVLFLMLNDILIIANPVGSGIEWGSKILAFMVGWFNYSFIRHLTGMFSKQVGIG